MVSSEIYHLKKSLSEDGIWFCFVGAISDRVFSEVRIALKSRSHLGLEEQSLVLPQKIFSIFLEQTRSLVQGSEGTGLPEKTSGTIMVCEKDQRPVLMLGLTLPTSHVQLLKGKIENLGKSETSGSLAPLPDQSDLIEAISNEKDSMILETLPLEDQMTFVSLNFAI